MKALAWLLTLLAVVAWVALVVFGYVGIFTHNDTLGWAAYMTFFVAFALSVAAAFALMEASDE